LEGPKFNLTQEQKWGLAVTKLAGSVRGLSPFGDCYTIHINNII